MTSREVSKLLRGRRITRVDLNAALNELSTSGTPLQNVVIHLDNGGRLSFCVHEHPEGADYGVSMAIVPCQGAEMVFTDKPGGGRLKPAT